MFAGPLHNLILAVVFFTVVLVGFGVPETTTTLASVPDCVLPAGAQSAAAENPCEVPIITSGAQAGETCTAGTAGCALPEASPASKAGLRAGDTIVALDGKPIPRETDTGWSQVQKAIRGSAATPVVFTVDRDGQRMDLTVTPIENTVYVDGGQRPDHPGRASWASARRRPTSASRSRRSRRSSATPSCRSVDKLAQIPQRVPQLFGAAFLGEQRDQNGPIGVVGRQPDLRRGLLLLPVHGR